MIDTNGKMNAMAWVTMIGGFLAVIVSLSVILGWKFDSSVTTQAQVLREEVKKEYVKKDVFELTIKDVRKDLRAIGSAVGARMPTDIP